MDDGEEKEKFFWGGWEMSTVAADRGKGGSVGIWGSVRVKDGGMVNDGVSSQLL